MLAYPTFLLLKASLPNTTVHALVPAYTRPMAECCRGIDGVVLDPGPNAGIAAQRTLLRQLRAARYDAVVTLFTTTRIGWLMRLAGIPYRLAPATKVAQIFYNKRLTQRRSRSAKPEHAYNLELGLKLLADHGMHDPRYPAPPCLQFPANEITALRAAFCRARDIAPADKLVFIHPGHGGSANNLSVDQFARLAQALHAADPLTFVITAGPGEEASAQRLDALLDGLRRTVYRSDEGLQRFAQHIQFADLFISGSTGPLHIAGALDRPTAGFYTRRRSATSLRWQTLNRPERRLAFSVPQTAAEEDMSAIDVVAAAASISRAFLS